MTVESYAQLEGLWDQAGGSPSLAPLMAAIAEAESGGNPASENTTDNNGTQTSWGLWQISDGTHNQPVPNILDPLVNAQQAVAKETGPQGLAAWGTYDSGAYRQFLQGGVAPSTSAPSASATAATTGFVWYEPWTWGSAAQQGIADVKSSLLRTAAEGLAVIAGLALVAWGVGRATGAGHRVETVAQEAAPAAAALA